MRKTVSSTASFQGVGLHSGAPSRATVYPHKGGLVFRRGRSVMRASWDNVRPSSLCTMLASPDDSTFTVSTVEHLMAALAGAGITDALIEVSGPEIPILDGSALPFYQGLMMAGVSPLNEEMPMIEIVEPVAFEENGAFAAFLPAREFSADILIDFAGSPIGRQGFSFVPSTDNFAELIAPARTFCHEADVRRMRASGLALGGSQDNAVVFGESGPLNPGGLRFSNEPARHKLLDAMGDLHLAGAAIRGRFVGYKSGHRMTNMLLHNLLGHAAPIARIAA